MRRKLIFIVLVLLLLLVSCQPTPEDEIVQNKNDGQLEEAIMQTAAPQTGGVQGSEEPIASESIVESRVNNTGTITIDVNADVILQGFNNVVIARLEKYYYSQSEVDNIIEAFYGDNLTYYDASVATKGDIETLILYMQQKLTDDEALLNSDYAVYGGITDLTDIKNHFYDVIENLKTKAANAPESRPLVSDTSISNGFDGLVDYNNDCLGNVSCSDPYA